MSLVASFYPAIEKSTLLAKAGETKIPGDIINGVESVVQSITGLEGWNITESTGTSTAKVRLWDGISKETNYLFTITLYKNESTRDFPPKPIIIKNGAIYLEIINGKVEGAINFG